MAGHASEFVVVLFAWTLAGIVSAFFFLNRNAALKRRLWPPFAVASAILLLVIVWWFLPSEALYVAAPLAALVTFINLRVVKFCNACGATTQNLPFRPARFCARCGHPLGSQ
jgi:hypothetical protein